MKVTIEQYRRIPEQMQQRTLIKEGVFIAERKSYDLRLCLFSLDSFYIEICQNEKGDVISHHCFPLDALPEQYLAELDISDCLAQL